MKVLIAGQGRSGSTALWRMAQRILKVNGENPGAGWDRSKAWDSDSHVLKVHAYSKQAHDWADVILTPRRDIREAVDSYERHIPNRVVSEESAVGCCGEMINLHDAWKNYSDYEVVYENSRENPKNEVKNISKAMGFESGGAAA